jgi:hypothetical protein
MVFRELLTFFTEKQHEPFFTQYILAMELTLFLRMAKAADHPP